VHYERAGWLKIVSKPMPEMTQMKNMSPLRDVRFCIYGGQTGVEY
jgi:hypothetical protein